MPTDREQRRVAIVDLGSNSFRLVVFRYRHNGPIELTNEIRDAVRLSAGMVDGALEPQAIARATATAGRYADFCRTAGIDEVIAVATSAIRDATNQADVLAGFAAAGLAACVLSTAEEAFYGYLGIVNSTTLEDGLFLDVGGGSAQIGRVSRRMLERSMSAPIGAVRTTEAFLTASRTKRSEVRALRKHVQQALDGVSWFGPDGLPLVGTGGTIRTLGAMAQRAAEYPLSEIHGYQLTREALGGLIDELLTRPVTQRDRIPGLKPDRADIILGGAVTIDTVMQSAGVERIEICSQGLREGLFYEHFLAPADPPLLADVRRAHVLNLAARYHDDRPHAEHVARLAQDLFDATARAGLHGADRLEREWLWAAAMLHDIGVVVDYHDHHKHGFYLVLNAGLPGYDHRELAMIAMLVRAHRKSPTSVDWLAPVLDDGDDERYWRLASCLRLAELLERDRAQLVRGVEVAVRGASATLTLVADAEPSVSLWAARSEEPVFQRAFGKRLRVAAELNR